MEVGTKGIFGKQASDPKAQDMWKVLGDVVDLMATNSTNQPQSIVEVTKAVAGGDPMEKQRDFGAEGDDE